MLNVKQKAVNTNVYGLRFDPTGNRTRVYGFNRKRSYQLNHRYDFMALQSQFSPAHRWGSLV